MSGSGSISALPPRAHTPTPIPRSWSGWTSRGRASESASTASGMADRTSSCACWRLRRAPGAGPRAAHRLTRASPARAAASRPSHGARRELAANPNRRGMIRATADGRGLEYADGTPFFLIGDTWWSVPSYRFPLELPDNPKALGPGATLNDYAHYRKAQGYNCVGLIAAQPAWANDGKPPIITMDDGTFVRAAWKQPGTNSAKDMHNEGGRPFEFPGKVPGFEDVMPDLDRINPDYFKVLDDKIDYLNERRHRALHRGVAARRRAGRGRSSTTSRRATARYVQYVFARYQANITILSPIHYDYYNQTIPAAEYYGADRRDARALRQAAVRHAALGQSQPLDAGQLRRRTRWVDLHQSGNVREHYTYWYLTEIFEAEPRSLRSTASPTMPACTSSARPTRCACRPDSEADRLLRALGPLRQLPERRACGLHLRRRGHLERRGRARGALPDVEVVHVANRAARSSTSRPSPGARPALPRARAQGRAGHAQQERPGLFVLRLGLLRADAGARPVPALLRERSTAACDLAWREGRRDRTGRPCSIRARGRGCRRASPSPWLRAPC